MPISHSIALASLGRTIITKPANRRNGPVLRPGCVPPFYHRSAELTPLRSLTSCNELPREDFPARRGCAQAPSCRATLSHLHSARRVARKLDKSRRGCSLRRYGMFVPERPRSGLRTRRGACPIEGVTWRRRYYGGRVRRWPSASCAIVRRGSSLWLSAQRTSLGRCLSATPRTSSLQPHVLDHRRVCEPGNPPYTVRSLSGTEYQRLLADFCLRRLEPLPRA